MFLIATFLDSVKKKANIESDYRLAKVIGVTHSAVTNYRTGRTLPNERVIEQLCALSGDDACLITAEIQAARANNEPAKRMWQMIALRLAAGVPAALVSIVGAIVLIATTSGQAKASTLSSHNDSPQSVYYVKWIVQALTALTFFSQFRQILHTLGF